MKTSLLIISFVIIFFETSHAQLKDEIEIRQVLKEQVNAWNDGDLKNFMQGYWQSDSLKFIGKSGINYGWNEALKNYKKGYPDTAAMGKLAFDIIETDRLSPLYTFVIGKWQLTRTIGDLSGYFTLLFKKINNKWLIIADHSS